MWVWHATDNEETAKHFSKHGINPSKKPSNLARSRYERGEDAEYAPGRGLSKGTYVGSTPQDVSGYGRHLLAIQVKRGHLKVPPEREALGWKANQGGHALADNDAVITHRVHPKNVHYFGRSDKYPKDAHHEFVQHALRSGHHVPDHVLKDYSCEARAYPHLQSKKVTEQSMNEVTAKHLTLYRGVNADGAIGYRSTEGVQGKGVNFYQHPKDAASYAGRGGGMLVANVKPEHAIVHKSAPPKPGWAKTSNVVVVPDPSHIIHRGMVPTEHTLSSADTLHHTKILLKKRMNEDKEVAIHKSGAFARIFIIGSSVELPSTARKL